MNCDLHMHSLFSDGTYTPAEIVAEAKKIGLGVIALTDHNTVAGLPDFIREAEQQDMMAIGGVELSTVHEGNEYHLLGLFIAPEHYQSVERLAKEFHVLKEISNIETIERLNDAGYMISYADVRKKNPTGNVNRAHIATELMEKGYVESVSHAFRELLSDGGGFYVPPQRLQLIDAILFLREIKAVPVLAHPLQDADEATIRNLLPAAVEAGLIGLETRHSSFDKATIETAEKIAADFNLLPSGGSDFHGKTKPNIHMGTGKGDLVVPMEYYHKLHEAHTRL